MKQDTLVAGRISAHRDGYGFLMRDEDDGGKESKEGKAGKGGKGSQDIFLPPRQMRCVFHGDRALVRIRGRGRWGREAGEIVEVLERGTKELMGRIRFAGAAPRFEALNRRLGHEMQVEGGAGGLAPGQVALAEVIEQPAMGRQPVVRIIKTLGGELTPALAVEAAIQHQGLPQEFSEAALEEAAQLPMQVTDGQIAGRQDLRRLGFVTIDGKDAKDFDDAVYCEPLSKGGWRLFVAIADVAQYVRAGTALDKDALLRGTSVYFPQRTLPMLPETLSNGLCSLNPDVDRLALVCEMSVSATGKLGGYRFCEAVIRSRARLTYSQVGAGLETGRLDPAHATSLANLHRLYLALAAQREGRGAIDLETGEARFEFDDAGRVSRVQPVTRNLAHRLIEECMLCANVSAARLIQKSGRPGLYRVHDRPEPQKVAALRDFLMALGYSLGGGEDPRPADFQAAAQQLAGKQNGQALQTMLLRAMQQAVYQPQNLGHFGLAYGEYAHFTSPIRRYPDLLVHRLVKSLIHAPACDFKEIVRQPQPDASHSYGHSLEQMAALGGQLSQAERRADDAVFEALEWLKCDYASRHLGDSFDGVITGAAKFGFFVQLQGLLVDGLVHLGSLGPERYRYDPATQTLSGDRSGQVFGVGDLVQVQLARVDPDERRIDLALLGHAPIKRRPLDSPRRRQAGKRRDASQRRKHRSGRRR